MGRWVKLNYRGFLKRNYLVFLITVLFLIMGVIFGTIAVKVLTVEQLNNLNHYLETSLESTGDNLNYQNTAKHAVMRNLETIFKIWFLGLTVVGLPLIMVIIFTRGFVLGFTVSFLLVNKGLEGFFLVLLTIFPQNILHIPALVFAGVAATGFSIYLVRGRKNDRSSIYASFLKYSFIILVLALIMVIAGIVEGYLSPFIAKIFKLF